MLDIRFIRENKDVVAAGAAKKRIKFDVEALLAVDDKRRALTTSIENKKAEQNQVSDKVVKATPEEKQALIEAMKELKNGLQAEEEELKTVMHEWQLLMVQVPNIPDMSVPEGDTDAENQEIRVVGERQILLLEKTPEVMQAAIHTEKPYRSHACARHGGF